MPKQVRQTEKLIMGVDPGTRFMGYGLVMQRGNAFEMISLGVVKMVHISDSFLRLKTIHSKISGLLQEYKPDCVAVEAPFYGKNVQSVLKLGRVQGIVMGVALNFEIPVFEYSPKKIKQAVTGNGNSTKEQVSKMVQVILKFKEETGMLLDATDALATALCHSFSGHESVKKTSKSNKKGSWDSFVKANTERVSH